MIDVAESDVDSWCRRQLGAGIATTLFTTGHLSSVIGAQLSDGRQVVVKVRPPARRLVACTQVQQHLWQAGFPCPQPIAGPSPLVEAARAGGGADHGGDGLVASAETFHPGGEKTAGVAEFAGLLARLIRLAPAATAQLAPNPPWTAWDHDGRGVWPAPDDRAADLNAHPDWLDEVGLRVRRRLSAGPAAARVVGHGDWEAQNLRWRDGKPWVVHDWDSVVSGPEVVLVGLAAAVWPCGIEPRAATVDESDAFLDAYQRAVGRMWTVAEVQAAWAAGLWVYAFNAKKASLDGVEWLTPAEADERLSRAVA